MLSKIDVISAGSSTRSTDSSILPASILLRSRIWLIRPSSDWPLLLTCEMSCCCSSLIGPSMPSSRICEKPMIADSGVRSSCETLARNSDFSLLARASSWLAACSSEVRWETFSSSVRYAPLSWRTI